MGVIAVTVDWVSFTLPIPPDLGALVETVELVCSWFGGSGGDLPRGRSGYTRGRLILGTGSVLWSEDRLDMGVHVDLPSKALGRADMEVTALLQLVLGRYGHFTRLDVALDTDSVTVAHVVQMEAAGDLISRTANRRLITDLRTGGQTLYIGSANSRRLVRIYDKAIEQDRNDGAVWTRIEVQFRAEYAHQAAVYAVAGHALQDLILATVDFRDDNGDSNRSRWPRSDWWAELVGAARERLQFGARSASQTVQDLYHWLNTQVAPTLALLCYFFGSYHWLHLLVDSGASRLQPWHISMLST